MKIVRNINELYSIIKFEKEQGKKIGFVPTMGYLHQGHLSLIEIAKENSDFVAVSIFVNPIQFGPNEDFDNYPRNEKQDLEFCEKMGADLVFLPEVKDVFSKNFSTKILNPKLSALLCGAKRPGHFDGVLTIVCKLFNMVNPDIAVFGLKDYQQFTLIKQMVEDLNFHIELIGAPIVRENDGLAMSSRNKYLNDIERKEATVLYKSLQKAKEKILQGEKNASKIKDYIIQNIHEKDTAKIDYVEIVDCKTLEEIEKIEDSCLIALAAYFGKARLIDNILITPED